MQHAPDESTLSVDVWYVPGLKGAGVKLRSLVAQPSEAATCTPKLSNEHLTPNGVHINTVCTRSKNYTKGFQVIADTEAGQVVENVPAVPSPPTSTDLVMAALPRGTILAWSNQKTPPGWSICDGTHGTPNLVGTAAASENGTTTGGSTHTHTALVVGSTGDARTNPDGWYATGEDRTHTPQATGLDHHHTLSVPITTAPGSNIPPAFG